ncbi:hypothetical protein [Bradyrhizobium liaoningense]|uniref:hypothetical protein n=1 Tax=Bradyrhizobium liaoningense TaxID=43992 RepID=UPI0020119E0F|nr:hypothetical protein [Bradyrhizobium liaoningense]
MRPPKTAIDRRERDVWNTVRKLAGIDLLGVVATPNPSHATNLGAARSLAEQMPVSVHNPDLIEVRAVARGGAVRRTTVVGPRGGAASRTVVRRGAVVGPGYAGGARWARPGHYYWPRGGAIAAGAAIGLVTAATAAAWAGAAPAPGMCWYYTDPSRRQGFWDYCQ